MTLCLDLPTEVFRRHQVVAKGTPDGCRIAFVPATVLNRFGPPKIYDHLYAGSSRVTLIQAIRAWEEYREDDPWKPDDERDGARRKVKEMRDAIACFDEIGWLTPLKVREASDKR